MKKRVLVIGCICGCLTCLSQTTKKKVQFHLDLAGERAQASSVGIRDNTPPLSWSKTYLMTDKDKNRIYAATVVFEQNEPTDLAIEYKYFHDSTSWESTGNRMVVAKNILTKLPVEKWNDEPVNKIARQDSVSLQALYNTIAALDSAMFATVYSCKPEITEKYFTEDMEFYHDKAGVTLTRKRFIESLSRNFCGDTEYKLRREVVPGTMKVFPMDTYGALQTGEHFFYQTPKGRQEKRTGIAKYMMLWQYKNGEWRISRVFSYDHQPANNK